MKMKIAAVVGLALASTASAQITMLPHDRIYTGFSRGFSFVAQSSFQISDLTLPTEAQAGLTEEAYFVNIAGTTVYHNTGAYAGGLLNVAAGDEVIIVGNWTPGAAGGAGQFTASNSYDDGSVYSTMIDGNLTELFRAGVQWDVGDLVGSTGLVPFSGLGGDRGRINVTLVPAPGAMALLGMGGLIASRRRRA